MLHVSSVGDLLNDLLVWLSGSAAVVGFVALLFWKADDVISKSGKDVLGKLVKQSIDEPERSELRQVMISFMNQYFSPRLPALKFVGNVAALTITSMAILFIAYLSMAGGFFEQISSDQYAAGLLLRQFFLDGFVVCFLVNYICFSIYSIVLGHIDLSAPKWNATVIAGDIVVKITLFIVLTISVYISFVYFFGSFLGSYGAAIEASITTIKEGLRFENLTGVYLYSVAISSLPLFLIFLINLLEEHRALRKLVSGLFFWLPFEGRPMRSIAVVLGIFAVVFFQISSTAVAMIST